MAGLRQAAKLRGAARIAQKYVERPLLLHGRKFDIRLYVLRCGWAPGALWLYEGMLLKVRSTGRKRALPAAARFPPRHTWALSTRVCRPPSAARLLALQVCSAPFGLGDLENKLAHLTNCAVQKEARRPSDAPDDELLWSSARFGAWLREHGRGEHTWERSVLPAIAALARAALASAHGAGAGAPERARSFEVFGLDVLLDDALRPWLLEVNASPNLRDHGCGTLEPMLDGLLEMVLGEAGAPTRAEPPAGEDRWRRI